MPPRFIVLPLLAAVLAIASGVAALWFTPGRARFVVPASGILLASVAAFGLIPELRERIGWGPALALVAAGFALLTLLDRAGVAVCPSCNHGEAFATSLVVAVGVHAFVDGWALTATQSASGPLVSGALAGAMLLHKVPEGLSLGAMLQASTPQPGRALLLLIAAESSTVAGGICGVFTAPGLWLTYLLALAAGTFLFLGLHALDLRPRTARENSL